MNMERFEIMMALLVILFNASMRILAVDLNFASFSPEPRDWLQTSLVSPPNHRDHHSTSNVSSRGGIIYYIEPERATQSDKCSRKAF
jgi:hypothetical protein